MKINSDLDLFDDYKEPSGDSAEDFFDKLTDEEIAAMMEDCVPEEDLMNPVYLDEEDDDKTMEIVKSLLVDLGEKPYTKTLYRDGVINQMMAVLVSENKPNCVLIGMPGSGKTKIAEELAHRIKKNDPSIPKQLKGCSIYMLSLSDIVSGCCLVGELERKLNVLVEYLADTKNKAIVFIDEIHMLFTSETYKRIAQILKPALSRGQIKTIAATTSQEISAMDTDPAFNRRFTRIIVDELTKEQTRDVVMSYIPVLAKHYGAQIEMSDSLAENIINIADEFSTAGSHRPDNALTLLDRAVADVVVAGASPKPGRSKSNKSKKIVLDERNIEITAYRMISGSSEIRRFDEREFTKALEYIHGQDDIIRSLTKVIKIYDLHIHPRNKPLTFLFAGSSGVGKTEISKVIASHYLSEKPIILNMTEYHDDASINRIIGAPNGYLGCDSAKELPFDILDTNPYQLILLDEFEKCCKSVQRLFMSAFESGEIKTAKGKVIDFSKCIIIATTNAGCTDRKNLMGFLNEDCVDSNVSFSELSRYFDVELINRFTHIYTFNNISEAVYSQILKECYVRELEEMKKQCRSEEVMREVMKHLTSELTEKDVRMLVKNTYNPQMGARPAHRAITEFIDNAVIGA